MECCLRFVRKAERGVVGQSRGETLLREATANVAYVSTSAIGLDYKEESDCPRPL